MRTAGPRVMAHSCRCLHDWLTRALVIFAGYPFLNAVLAVPAGCTVAEIGVFFVVARRTVCARIRVALVILPCDVFRRKVEKLLELDSRTRRDRRLCIPLC